jgi:hypothetical protein
MYLHTLIFYVNIKLILQTFPYKNIKWILSTHINDKFNKINVFNKMELKICYTKLLLHVTSTTNPHRTFRVQTRHSKNEVVGALSYQHLESCNLQKYYESLM